MSVYMISFDLENKQTQNYDKVDNAIQKQGNWAKILNTTYILISSSTSEQIINKVQNNLDKNDKLFIAKLNGETAWTESFSQEIKNWLLENIVHKNL